MKSIVPIHSGSQARICIVVSAVPPAFSGAGLRAYRYACRLHQEGRLAFIIAERPERDAILPERLDVAEKIPQEMIFQLPNRQFRKRYRAQSMARHKAAFLFQVACMGWSVFHLLWRKRHEYDLVYSFGAGGQLQLYATLAARLFGKKSILSITLLGIEDPLTIQKDSHPLRRWFRTRAFAAADAYISISRPITEACGQAGTPPGKTWEIPNPVDVRLFAPCPDEERKSLRRELGIDAEVFALIFVGSVVKRKGIDLLVEALGLLCKEHNDIRLLVLGSCAARQEGEERFSEKLQGRISQLGLTDKVEFVGLASRVPLYMKACDVFVFPSRSEGFPNVLVEAMASGLPVVTCPMSGIAAYIVTHQVDGLIVDYHAEAIAEAVGRLRHNPDYRGRLATEARRTVLARFSTEIIDAHYDRVYAAVLNPKTSCGTGDCV